MAAQQHVTPRVAQRGDAGAGLTRFTVGLIFAVALTAAITAVQIAAPALLRFEHDLADRRTAVLSDRRDAQHPRIAVVMIDEQTLEKEAYTSPIDRAVLARLIRRLDQIGVKAVALDILFYKPTEPAKDEELAATLRSVRSKIILAAGDSRADIEDRERAYQKKFLAAAGRPAGYVNLSKDSDDVVRRKLGPAKDDELRTSFAALLAAEDGGVEPDPGGRIAWLRRARNGEDAFLTINALDILEDGPVATLLRPKLEGRLILIGGGFADRDRHLTPLLASDGYRGTGQVHGVFLHAHILAQVLDNRSIRELPYIPVVLLIGLLGFHLGWSFHKYGFSWLLGSTTTIVLIGLDLFMFWRWSVILPYTPATIAWIVGVLGGYFLRFFFKLDAEPQGRAP